VQSHCACALRSLSDLGACRKTGGRGSRCGSVHSRFLTLSTCYGEWHSHSRGVASETHDKYNRRATPVHRTVIHCRSCRFATPAPTISLQPYCNMVGANCVRPQKRNDTPVIPYNLHPTLDRDNLPPVKKMKFPWGVCGDRGTNFDPLNTHFHPLNFSTVHLKFPPANKRSKSGENRVKSRVYATFVVEKTVENVKSSGGFSPLFLGDRGEIPPTSPADGQNCCGKVDETVENS